MVISVGTMLEVLQQVQHIYLFLDSARDMYALFCTCKLAKSCRSLHLAKKRIMQLHQESIRDVIWNKHQEACKRLSHPFRHLFFSPKGQNLIHYETDTIHHGFTNVLSVVYWITFHQDYRNVLLTIGNIRVLSIDHAEPGFRYSLTDDERVGFPLMFCPGLRCRITCKETSCPKFTVYSRTLSDISPIQKHNSFTLESNFGSSLEFYPITGDLAIKQ